MAEQQGFVSCFDTIYDTAVFGAGYSGFAAALALVGEGRSVLLIDPRGDVLWESGRAFAPEAGDAPSGAWKEFKAALWRRGAADGGTIEGAVAEILATDMLARSGVALLYYAWPAAAGMRDDRLESLSVATKAGLRTVRARTWVDATERGDLLRLCGCTASPREPERLDARLFLQRSEWTALAAEPTEAATFGATLRPTERALTVRVEAQPEALRAGLLDALAALQEAVPEAAREAVVSHWSRVPYPTYGAGPGSVACPDNVACAAPVLVSDAVKTPADRFVLGEKAAEFVLAAPGADVSPDTEPQAPAPARTMRADVCVAGLGTGGALAAIAAGHMFGSEVGHVLAIDPLFEPGGTGTAGHVHGYYFGVPGGLQAEVDERVAAFTRRYGDALDMGVRFHPLAKEAVLDRMIHEAGVLTQYGTMLAGVERQGGRVVNALAIGPGGPVRIEAEQWIDGTGDGDLCAFAGADFYVGRESDGRMHACSQHIGFVYDREGRATFYSTNHDIGWVEPWDAEDLTRARVQGVRNYAQERYDDEARPVFVAPFIGVRQGRQVITDYMVTLDDMVMRRRFDDCIGFAACWLDNHAKDAEFESDEYAFWVWHALTARVHVACDLPYRVLLPQGLDNVTIASRCLGVEQEPEYSIRMQRDLQRTGEATGYAAALAATHGTTTRHVPFEVLAFALRDSGALARPTAESVAADWRAVSVEEMQPPPPERQRVADALAKLDAGQPGTHLWYLYKSPDLCHDDVLARIGSADDIVSWLAAGVAAMWGEPAAEERLLKAVREREEGPTEDIRRRAPHPSMREGGEADNRLVPWWLDAIVLLRRCGTARALPVLAEFASSADHMFDTRAALALTLERLVERDGDLDRDTAAGMLDALVRGPMPGADSLPTRPVGRMARQSLEGPGAVEVPDAAFRHSLQKPEDQRWQLHLVVARTRLALGLPPQDEAAGFLHDERAYVRRAFSDALED